MRRRDILAQESPPRFWLIQHEASLRCPVGGPDIMYEQLAAVITAAKSPRTTIQVLPFSAGAHAAMIGPLTLLGHRHQVAYCEGHAGGWIITDPDEFAECAHSFDLLQSEALPPSASLDLIREVMEGYKS